MNQQENQPQKAQAESEREPVPGAGPAAKHTFPSALGYPVQRVQPAGAVVQRTVDLEFAGLNRVEYNGSGGQLNFLWGHIGPELDERGLSRYGRKKQLGIDLRNDDSLGPFTSIGQYVDDLVRRTPRKSESGRFRPGWDNFWKGITTSGMHRRHIVMSSVMRNAVYAVTDMALGSNELEACCVLYSRLLGQGEPDACNQLALHVLENQLVARLHNHKSNIFIDVGGWNSAIGGLAHAFEKLGNWTNEDFAHHVLEQCDTVRKLKQAQADFVGKLKTAAVFSGISERKKIAEVVADMLAKTGTDWTGTSDVSMHDHEQLEALKADTYEVMRMGLYSMATDISTASDHTMRAHQNKLFQFNGWFMDIANAPSFDKLYTVAGQFLAHEKVQHGSAGSMGTLAFFRGITHPDRRGRVKLAKSGKVKPKDLPLTGSGSESKHSGLSFDMPFTEMLKQEKSSQMQIEEPQGDSDRLTWFTDVDGTDYKVDPRGRVMDGPDHYVETSSTHPSGDVMMDDPFGQEIETVVNEDEPTVPDVHMTDDTSLLWDMLNESGGGTGGSNG